MAEQLARGAVFSFCFKLTTFSCPARCPWLSQNATASANAPTDTPRPPTPTALSPAPRLNTPNVPKSVTSTLDRSALARRKRRFARSRPTLEGPPGEDERASNVLTRPATSRAVSSAVPVRVFPHTSCGVDKNSWTDAVSPRLFCV